MNNEESPLVAGWWARLPDGGMRRIWATLADGIYRCRVEVCSPAQEEARMRLFQAVSAADALGRPLDHDGSADALVWSCSTFASLDTNDADEARHFLGDDELARCALAAAEALALIHGDGSGTAANAAAVQPMTPV